MSFQFPAVARLDARGVEAVLESGIRLRGKAGTPWLVRLLAASGGNGRSGADGKSATGVTTTTDYAANPARLAISVPKRLVKSSVSRNYLKRQAREAFRQHRVRLLPLDMLVSVVTSCPDESRAARAANRAALVSLLDQAANRVGVTPAAPASAG